LTALSLYIPHRFNHRYLSSDSCALPLSLCAPASIISTQRARKGGAARRSRVAPVGGVGEVSLKMKDAVLWPAGYLAGRWVAPRSPRRCASFVSRSAIQNMRSV